MGIKYKNDGLVQHKKERVKKCGRAKMALKCPQKQRIQFGSIDIFICSRRCESTSVRVHVRNANVIYNFAVSRIEKKKFNRQANEPH